MADADYKRLGCISFECEGEHKAKGLCATHYKRLQRTGSIVNANILCVHCSKPIESRQQNAMYCSKSCKLAAWNAKNGRIKYDYVRLVSTFWASYCINCKTAIGGRRQRTLCNDCDVARKRAAATVWAVLNAEKKHKEFALVIACAECSLLFCPLYGASNAKLCLCCKSERQRKATSISRTTRKMRKKCQTVERVNPFKVFDRDKWICQLCKNKTPKALRGSLDPRAPELDHIMPISLGGEHSYRNTQCSCRACNGAKSNRPMGQMLLIG